MLFQGVGFSASSSLVDSVESGSVFLSSVALSSASLNTLWISSQQTLRYEWNQRFAQTALATPTLTVYQQDIFVQLKIMRSHTCLSVSISPGSLSRRAVLQIQKTTHPSVQNLTERIAHPCSPKYKHTAFKLILHDVFRSVSHKPKQAHRLVLCSVRKTSKLKQVINKLI